MSLQLKLGAAARRYADYIRKQPCGVSNTESFEVGFERGWSAAIKAHPDVKRVDWILKTLNNPDCTTGEAPGTLDRAGMDVEINKEAKQ